jgi:hypothetical protein
MMGAQEIWIIGTFILLLFQGPIAGFGAANRFVRGEPCAELA